ncbi:MAG TPA: hypothetical protein VNL14_19275 [Candidatus Acidoferrales bacterium]|nr:hypothetical protein [Candidatus Acidoferrales bacterium]
MFDDSKTEGKDSGASEFERVVGGFVSPEEPARRIVWTPEKHLAAAVLTDALIEVRDLAQHPGHRKQVAEDLEWIFSDATESPFSFLELCGIFDLDPSYVRGVVVHWLRDALRALGVRVDGGRRASASEFVARVVRRLREE